MCVLRICDHVPTHFNFYCDCALVPLLCLLYKHVAIIICLRTTAWMSSRPPALCGCSRLLWSFWAIKINSAYSKKKKLWPCSHLAVLKYSVTSFISDQVIISVAASLLVHGHQLQKLTPAKI